MKKRKLLAAVGLSLAVALTACIGGKTTETSGTTGAAQETSEAAKDVAPIQAEEGEKKSDKDSMIVAMDREPASLDPNGNNVVVKRMIDNCLYDTLLKFDENLTPVASLAESWEQVDDTTWKFNLRKDVKFHDGTPLTSKDVLFSFKRLANSSNGNNLADHFDPEGYEAPDDYTFILKTTTPYAFVEATLCSPGLAIVPEAEVEKVGDDAFGRNPVGSGPYKFVSWTAGDSIVIEKNEDYWGDQSILNTITFRIITESSSRTIDLESGGIDLALSIPNTDADRIAENADTQLILHTGATDRYIALNCQSDVLKDVRVRQALNYATDSESIRQVCYGADTSEPMLSVVPSTLQGYRSDLEQYGYDIDKAKSLLEEAGYGDGLTVEFKYLASSNNNMLAELLQQMWGQVGVTLELNPTESGTLTSALNKGDFDICCAGTNFPLMEAGAGLYDMFHTSSMYSGNDRSELSDPEVDAVLDQVIVTTDADERAKLVEQAQELIHADAPFIYLAYTKSIIGASSKLRGFDPIPTSMYDFRSVYFVE